MIAKKKLLAPEIYDKQAEICGALANPVRLMILDLLADGEGTASELQQRLDLPKANLSQHLTVLKRAGILKARTDGRYQYLSLSLPEIKEACALVKQVLLTQLSQQALLVKNLR